MHPTPCQLGSGDVHVIGAHQLRVVDVRVAAHLDGAVDAVTAMSKDTTATQSTRFTPPTGWRNAGKALIMAFAETDPLCDA
jgi:hypothetical protein